LCKKHGIFSQKPNNHLSGFGCFICKSSKGESKIFSYLKTAKIDFIQEYYLPILGQYIDFYLPGINIGLEYDGIQHFIPIEFFGGEIGFKKTKIRDGLKDNYCKENNIKLYRISYLDIDKIESILNNSIIILYIIFYQRFFHIHLVLLFYRLSYHLHILCERSYHGRLLP
jgi:hypothetical protein